MKKITPVARCVFVVLGMLLMTACGIPLANEHDDNAPTPVSLTAAFTPISEAVFFNEAGERVAAATDQNPVVMLRPGTYYVDIRDDHGTATFSNDGRLMFAPDVLGAEMEIAPFVISSASNPVIKIHVGNHSHDHDPAVLKQGVHTFGGDTAAMRARLVWEGARAMVGSGSASSYTWPTGTNYGSSNYVGEDTGAWNSVRSAYGTATSCRYDTDDGNWYTPCNLTYGPDNASQYGYQGGSYRGGQCKAFANLVAYRSGVYHGTSWAFVALPTDANTASPQDPYSSIGSVQAGDILRRVDGSTPHALIVTRVIGGGTDDVVVLDSNWSNGNETISTHVLDYSGSGITDLDTYNTYNCVYTSSTSDGC